LHPFDKDVGCMYPFQRGNRASIRKMRIGKYHHGWQKTIDILKQDGHLLFGGQEIQEDSKDKKIKAAYENPM